eukprot:102472-Prorocentrum_lima.AAC.1
MSRMPRPVRLTCRIATAPAAQEAIASELESGRRALELELELELEREGSESSAVSPMGGASKI